MRQSSNTWGYFSFVLASKGDMRIDQSLSSKKTLPTKE